MRRVRRSDQALTSINQGGVKLNLLSSLTEPAIVTLSYSCSIADPFTPSLILTGGYHTLEVVSRYSEAGWEADLPSLLTGRFWHGCGGYVGDGGQFVLAVTGGVRADLTYLSSTEIFMSGLWREAGPLPVASMLTGLNLNNDLLMIGEFKITT